MVDSMTYNAVMKTPIGYRVGNILVDITDQIISGIISFFGREGKYKGELYDNGDIKIKGVLPTPNDNIEFEGEGKISYHSIHLSIPSKDFVYELDGTSRG